MNLINSKIENFVQKSTSYNIEPKKSKTDIRQLIDLDLFRGKPFQKAKPLYHWWMDQMGFLPFLFFLILYILELTTFLIYLVCKNVREKFTFTEANTYILITFMVGEIYNHVIAKNLTRPNHSKLRVPVDSPPKRSSSMHTFPSPLVNTYNESLKISNRRNKKKKKLSTDSLMREIFNCKDKIDIIDAVWVLSIEHYPNPFSQGILDLESEQNYTNESDLRVRKKFVKKNYKLTDEESNRLTDIGESEGSGNESVSDITHTSLSVSESEQKEPVFSVSDNKNEPEFNNVIIMSNKDHIQEEVMVTFFESTGTRKVKISIWEIFEIIEQRVNHTNVEFNYFYLFLIISIFFSLLPYFFEVFAVLSNSQKNANSFNIINLIYTCYFWFKDNDVIIIIEMFLIVFIRFIMVGCFLFLLFVAEKTYQLRFLYAKFFGALTSSRRAKRNRLPHFRLHKVKNIKAWLSLRSYLRRSGPLRSIDLVVSCTFYLSIIFITLVCLKFLIGMNYQKSDATFMEQYLNWEIPSWALLLSSFLLRFLSLGAEVNRKYNNNTELLTEQINLYLYMEMYPQKKDEYTIANNVLKLASKLIREIEAPQKVTGFIMNPLLRNITRVVILSLISGVISDIFGVSFKFWKIKAS
ncbi:hypothetical protein HZS_2346 [Henneguya salminicola]|nr:hypothetical protein HZS_2346 [Henneguya salminicola]